MPVPVVLATCAAVGSLVTSVKSGWELRRMIKRKQEQFVAEEEAPYIFRRLRRAHREGILNDREYEDWYEKFLIARAEKDLPALHRIRAHLRIMEAGAPGRSLTNGSSRSSSSSRSASLSSSPRSKQTSRSRRHSVDEYSLPEKYTSREKGSRRRSVSPREQRRRRAMEKTQYSDVEEETETGDDERAKTRHAHRSRSSSSVSQLGRDHTSSRRRETTWPKEGLPRYDEKHVGARPDQFVPFAASSQPRVKRASTVTGYAVAPGPGGGEGIPVPVLLPAPMSRRASTAHNSSRSSSATAASRRRRGEVESERDSSDTDVTEFETDVEDKRWQKKQLPSSATRESRRRQQQPWEKAMEEGRQPWEKRGRDSEKKKEEESEWDEKRDKVKA